MHSGDVEIENEVKALVKSAEKETKKLKQGEAIDAVITIQFKTEDKSKYLAFLDKKSNKRVFEEWEIPLRIIQAAPTSISVQEREDSLQKAVFQIVELANSHYDHIDESQATSKAATGKVSIFPFELNFKKI